MVFKEDAKMRSGIRRKRLKKTRKIEEKNKKYFKKDEKKMSKNVKSEIFMGGFP